MILFSEANFILQEQRHFISGKEKKIREKSGKSENNINKSRMFLPSRQQLPLHDERDQGVISLGMYRKTGIIEQSRKNKQ